MTRKTIGKQRIAIIGETLAGVEIAECLSKNDQIEKSIYPKEFVKQIISGAAASANSHTLASVARTISKPIAGMVSKAPKKFDIRLLLSDGKSPKFDFVILATSLVDAKIPIYIGTSEITSEIIENEVIAANLVPEDILVHNRIFYLPSFLKTPNDLRVWAEVISEEIALNAGN